MLPRRRSMIRPGDRPAEDSDRQIERHCIVCCSPTNLHITPSIRRDLL